MTVAKFLESATWGGSSSVLRSARTMMQSAVERGSSERAHLQVVGPMACVISMFLYGLLALQEGPKCRYMARSRHSSLRSESTCTWLPAARWRSMMWRNSGKSEGQPIMRTVLGPLSQGPSRTRPSARKMSSTWHLRSGGGARPAPLARRSWQWSAASVLLASISSTSLPSSFWPLLGMMPPSRPALPSRAASAALVPQTTASGKQRQASSKLRPTRSFGTGRR
mmetsp:Transcript_25985/g.82042  ORF Transcript_25985/g.82042 Transcript_25985/m.82042 type:complete len:224 (+) Transcript_25985:573-1244(+)